LEYKKAYKGINFAVKNMWDITEYRTLLQDALKRNETVIITCKCSVKYSGRAESYLEEGDRIVLIKADNKILVSIINFISNLIV